MNMMLNSERAGAITSPQHNAPRINWQQPWVGMSKAMARHFVMVIHLLPHGFWQTASCEHKRTSTNTLEDGILCNDYPTHRVCGVILVPIT
jgi:hypothetical protein